MRCCVCWMELLPEDCTVYVSGTDLVCLGGFNCYLDNERHLYNDRNSYDCHAIYYCTWLDKRASSCFHLEGLQWPRIVVSKIFAVELKDCRNSRIVNGSTIVNIQILCEYKSCQAQIPICARCTGDPFSLLWLSLVALMMNEERKEPYLSSTLALCWDESELTRSRGCANFFCCGVWMLRLRYTVHSWNKVLSVENVEGSHGRVHFAYVLESLCV